MEWEKCRGGMREVLCWNKIEVLGWNEKEVSGRNARSVGAGMRKKCWVELEKCWGWNERSVGGRTKRSAEREAVLVSETA